MTADFAPTIDVITIGESMAMFVADQAGPLADAQRYTRHLAGAETNVAIGLARLGMRTAWVSRLGEDLFGNYVLDRVQREGVDCRHVRRDRQRPTGFMLKAPAAAGGDPEVAYWRRGSAASALSPADFEEELFATARHLHVTGITPALSLGAAQLVERAMTFMRESGRSVSFDPNLRPRLWPSREHMAGEIRRFAALADWVLPGLEEGRLLTGHEHPPDIAAFFMDRGARAVVVKLGPEGAYHATESGGAYVPATAVSRVVDTVGAGDGFAAGVISARLEGLGWGEAVARGNWIGARAVQTPGDMDGLPYRHELPATQEQPA